MDYQNPRLVVGCIVQHEGRILLCRRGIEPQRGLWTVPAGEARGLGAEAGKGWPTPVAHPEQPPASAPPHSYPPTPAQPHPAPSLAAPAGYLECGESSAAGAARETLEEAGARVDIQGPFCHYDIPGISQIYVLFRGRLAPPFTYAAQQPESLEAALFAPEEIPWDQLAFSSVSIALRRCAWAGGGGGGMAGVGWGSRQRFAARGGGRGAAAAVAAGHP